MSFRNSSTLVIIGATIIIIFAIVITSIIENQQHSQSFSQVITVGPLWPTNNWSCTSSADFMVYGALRGLTDSQLAITINGLGSQSLYLLDSGKLEPFSVGSPGGHVMTITRTGSVTGWITLQTLSGAKANCTES